MKKLVLLLCVVGGVQVGCSRGPAETAEVSLAPVPFALRVPAAIAPFLSTGPIEGPFGEQVMKDGALAATTLYYQPTGGERTIYMTAYWFPADNYDAFQQPNQPPLFGFEVLRADGNVLSVAGPLDAIFAPDSPDGRNLETLYGLINLPETYRRLP